MKQLLLPTLLTVLAACGGEPTESPEPSGDDAASAALPETFWSTETVDAVDVFDLREGVPDGDRVVVRGTVQGFVDGFAAFNLVEDTLLSCDERPGDTCETPWDYCCTPKEDLVRGTALVEFHDAGGPGAWELKGFHGIDLLSEVVVSGTLHVDEAANLRIVADSIRLQ
jgi:hypothetical protein